MRRKKKIEYLNDLSNKTIADIRVEYPPDEVIIEQVLRPFIQACDLDEFTQIDSFLDALAERTFVEVERELTSREGYLPILLREIEREKHIIKGKRELSKRVKEGNDYGRQ